MSEPRERRVLKAVLKRATTDRTFRQQLLEDPRAAIEREFGIRIPPEYRLRFIERDPDVDALVVLPDLRPDSADGSDDGELSDDDLEDVAGGTEQEMDEELCWADEGDVEF